MPTRSATHARAKPSNPPRHAEQQRLDQRLAQNSRSAGAQREAYGDLAPAADDAHQQQSGEIGAGDKEHHDDGEEERADQRTSLRHCGLIERLDATDECGGWRAPAGSCA